MKRMEFFYFAADALFKVATEDPFCIPLRLFFDREANVLTTRLCYEKAFEAFARDRIDREKARISFNQYFDKVEVLDVDSKETDNFALKYDCDEACASLLAAIKNKQASRGARSGNSFLVTSDKALIEAACGEGINFHDYTEQEFCEKYSS